MKYAIFLTIFLVACVTIIPEDPDPTTSYSDDIPNLPADMDPLADPTTIIDPRRCDLAPDPGPCEAYMKAYYYDPDAGCTEFGYGGCDGVVPFSHIEFCELACEIEDTPPPATEPEPIPDPKPLPLPGPVDLETEYDSPAETFQGLLASGVKGAGIIPIEGIDKGTIMSVYPGFIDEDFIGVKTALGSWQEVDGEVVYVNDDERGPMHSAYGQITAEGYATLLENTGPRYGINPTQNSHALTLVNRLRQIPPVEPTCASNSECIVGGCSGTICAHESEDTSSTCEWREEYACYQQTSCGCIEGQCAWAQTDVFIACQESFS